MDDSQSEVSASAELQENFFLDYQLAETESVLALFSESFQQEFFRRSSLGAVESGGLRYIPYDRNLVPAIAPELLFGGIDQQALLFSLADANRGFGFVEESGFWLDIKTDKYAKSGNLLHVPQQVFNELLNEIFPGHSMTAAERRVLMQVICGQSLKDAAAVDGVSRETKKSQLKAVSQETGLNRQIDLCTYILSRLLLNLMEREPEKQPSHQVIRDYHRRFMPSGVRLHVLVGVSGRQHRVFDMGPSGGRVIVVLHAQVLPWFRDEDIAALHEQQLRLIWPMRPGALAPEDGYLSSTEHLDRSLEAIQCASELASDDRVIDLLSVSSGSFFATEYACRFPERVNRLIYVSAGYKPTLSRSWLDRYYRGLSKMIRDNPATARLMFHFFAKKFGERAILADTLKKLFAGSEPDLAVLENEFSEPETFDAIQIRFSSSAKSIYQDFIFYTYPNWHKVAKLQKLTFIHGEFDRTHRGDDIAALARSAGAQFIANAGVGQLHYYEHLPNMLRLVASILQEGLEKQANTQ